MSAASSTVAVFLEVSNPKLEVPAAVKRRADFPFATEPAKAR